MTVSGRFNLQVSPLIDPVMVPYITQGIWTTVHTEPLTKQANSIPQETRQNADDTQELPKFNNAIVLQFARYLGSRNIFNILSSMGRGAKKPSAWNQRSVSRRPTGPKMSGLVKSG